jgi:hypothetical protein
MEIALYQVMSRLPAELTPVMRSYLVRPDWRNCKSHESALIREHIDGLEIPLYRHLDTKYRSCDTCELIMENLSLYGAMLTLKSLGKQEKGIFFRNLYHKREWTYYMEMS